MKRPHAPTLALLLALAGPALAQSDATLTPTDEILSTLLSRGYTILEDERTWLGRQRILAEKDGTLREVVFIPGTGEILRDYSVRKVLSDDSRFAGTGNSGTTGIAASGGAIGVTGSADAAPGLSLTDTLGTGRTLDGAVVGVGSSP